MTGIEPSAPWPHAGKASHLLAGRNRRWVDAEAAEFLHCIVDEHIDVDAVHGWMEQHYQRPFSPEIAAAMYEALLELVDEP